MKYGNNSQSILFFNPKSVPVRLSLTKKYRTDETIIRFIWAEVVERVIVCHKHAFVAFIVSKSRILEGIYPRLYKMGLSIGWSKDDRTMIEPWSNTCATSELAPSRHVGTGFWLQYMTKEYSTLISKGGTKGGLWQPGYSIFYVLTTLITPVTFPTFPSLFSAPVAG